MRYIQKSLLFSCCDYILQIYEIYHLLKYISIKTRKKRNENAEKKCGGPAQTVPTLLANNVVKSAHYQQHVGDSEKCWPTMFARFELVQKCWPTFEVIALEKPL